MPSETDVLDGFDLGAALHMLRPSEYTAALIQTLLGLPSLVRGANALEIGSGSGVVLAALAEMGAASICGVDSEEQAIQAGEAMMEGRPIAAEFHRGDLWQPIGDRRFNLVVSNLPQFPTDSVSFPGRLPSWSHGGHDGRQFLDPFLDALAAHLMPAGRAIMTHNAFIDLAETRRRLAQSGLRATILRTVLVTLPNEKLKVMSPEIRAREEGRTIHTLGAYSFGRMHVLGIGTRRTDG